MENMEAACRELVEMIASGDVSTRDGLNAYRSSPVTPIS
jgi:hypothetical protein